MAAERPVAGSHHDRQVGHVVDDHGTHSEASVDYPPICMDVARAVVSGRADRGIVLGGSGQGEQIAANKVPGVRAALCGDAATAAGARRWNDANVLALSLRLVTEPLATEIVDAWRGHLGLPPAPVITIPSAPALFCFRVGDVLGWLGWRTPLRSTAWLRSSGAAPAGR